ncbi:oxidoreductase [Sphingobacterium sp. SGG-5]|uniref:putative oxidoreductase C-terminal domain-containing protein n=1 Tax=Sphingobacterium sp. SGG-5 TaxID=2710881 RepID=UPI0013ED75FB|nr:putative oxidoreductase C-terminal domain-containing protein [Sphingobacterium sp. SGG-5]NGM62716.1 oxidoreductase [Sphingobacterium sp. SGG-5]
MKNIFYFLTAILLMNMGCGSERSSENKGDTAELLVIDPQHFHAALTQKYANEGIDTLVHLFAESENTATGYTELIEQYNSRDTDPTHWNIVGYYGADFLEKAFQGATGNVVVLAGDNQKKIDYITQAVQHDRDVFADKPLVIDVAGYNKLKALMGDNSKEHPTLIYDIMTERYDVKNQIIKALINNREFSGGLQAAGSEPVITFASTHHFIKEVSGKPLIRPVLFFNTKQQGEGLVDVTTHYVDLVQWMLSSEQVIDIERDIQLTGARRWATTISKADFTRVTNLAEYPSSLLPDVAADQTLEVFSNGKMDYSFKGVPVSISVEWAVESLDGRGDQFRASFRAKQLTLDVKADENAKMAVFLTPGNDDTRFEDKLKSALASIADLPGLSYEKVNGQYKILIPETLYLSHEEHFAKVLQQFLQYRKDKSLPAWEKSFILAKYYLTTKSLEYAKR